VGDGKTRVDAVIGVPVKDETERTSKVEFVVSNTAGEVLFREAWTDTISERLAAVAKARGGTEITVPLNFAVHPGTYKVNVTVTRGSERDSAQQTITAFAAQPLMSDVLVTNRVRALAENEQPTSAEVRKGRLAIEQGTRTTILPTEPKLSYYLELYPVGGAKVNEVLDYAIVRASGGDPIFRTSRPIEVNERGGVDAAAIPVQGLPPGDYKLLVTAKLNERTEQHEAAFTMGSMADVPVVATAAPGANISASEADLLDKYFAPAVRSDSSIVQLVEALTLASPGEAVPKNTMQLPVEAKRRWLARFWSKMPDRVPGTPQHELLEEYISRVDFVAHNYVERDIGRSGARTDRGRIYLKFGPPDAKQPLPMQGNRAVEVWKYTRSRNLKFAFLDETGFSNFNLIYTTDPNEQTLADWQDRVRDLDTIRLILNF
jgi:GWxTD domain-containing protein